MVKNVDRNPLIFTLETSSQEDRAVSILTTINETTTMYSLGILEQITETRVKQCHEFIIFDNFHYTKPIVPFRMLIMFAFNNIYWLNCPILGDRKNAPSIEHPLFCLCDVENPIQGCHVNILCSVVTLLPYTQVSRCVLDIINDHPQRKRRWVGNNVFRKEWSRLIGFG